MSTFGLSESKLICKSEHKATCVVSIDLFRSHIVCFRTMDALKLSVCDAIVSQKGSNGDGKQHFFGRGCILLALFAQKQPKG